MQLITVKIEKSDDTNFILGQTHFIKSVEDIHEALVTSVPGINSGWPSARLQASASSGGPGRMPQ
jgi:adenosine/AMP kinase